MRKFKLLSEAGSEVEEENLKLQQQVTMSVFGALWVCFPSVCLSSGSVVDEVRRRSSGALFSFSHCSQVDELSTGLRLARGEVREMKESVESYQKMLRSLQVLICVMRRRVLLTFPVCSDASVTLFARCSRPFRASAGARNYFVAKGQGDGRRRKRVRCAHAAFRQLRWGD